MNFLEFLLQNQKIKYNAYLCIHSLYFFIFKISGGVKCTINAAIVEVGAPI